MKHWKLIAIVAVVTLCAFPAMAQKAGMATDTQHGAIGATPCGSCHTPHTGTNGNVLLWTNAFAGAAVNYTMYQSPTLDSTPGALSGVAAGGATPGDPSNNTLLCLSCHDGAVAATNGVTLETATYGAAGTAVAGTAIDVGTDLSNDHPINMTLDNVADPGLDSPANVTTAGLVLYSVTAGPQNTVQCGSCHDPHKSNTPGTGDYLRIANAASALCLTCHL